MPRLPVDRYGDPGTTGALDGFADMQQSSRPSDSAEMAAQDRANGAGMHAAPQADATATAAASVDRAEATAADDPEGLLQRTRALVKQKRLEEAAELFPGLLQVERSDSRWNRALGRIATALQAWDKVAVLWSKIAHEDANDTEAVLNLAQAYVGLGNGRLALAYSEQLHARAPAMEEAQRLLAHSYLLVGLPHRAERIIRHLLEMNRRRTVIWLDRLEAPWANLVKARLRWQSESREDAESERQEALAANLARGLRAEMRADWAAAFAAFGAAVAADATNLDAMDGLNRARAAILSVLSGDGASAATPSASIKAADLSAAVFADAALLPHVLPVLERVVQEDEFHVARLIATDDMLTPSARTEALMFLMHKHQGARPLEAAQLLIAALNEQADMRPIMREQVVRAREGLEAAVDQAIQDKQWRNGVVLIRTLRQLETFAGTSQAASSAADRLLMGLESDLSSGNVSSRPELVALRKIYFSFPLNSLTLGMKLRWACTTARIALAMLLRGDGRTTRTTKRKTRQSGAG